MNEAMHVEGGQLVRTVNARSAVTRPDLTHPDWCAPAFCRVHVEVWADGSIGRDGMHLSDMYTLATDHDVTIEVAVGQELDYTGVLGPRVVYMRMYDVDGLDFAAQLTVGQSGRLRDVLERVERALAYVEESETAHADCSVE